MQSPDILAEIALLAASKAQREAWARLGKGNGLLPIHPAK